MPRQIKELIYYERTKILHRNWCYRVLLKLPRIKKGLRLRSRYTSVLQPLPLFRAALDFERERNNQDFDRKLRKNSPKNLQSLPRRYFRSICMAEEYERKARAEDAKSIYLKHLKKQKYG